MFRSMDRADPIAVCLSLTRAIGRSAVVEDIYTAALDALEQGVGVSRASILLFEADGVMRFQAHRGLSAGYRAAVEGHTPWTPGMGEVEPIVVADVERDASLAPYLDTIRGEGIAAMTFVPLHSLGSVIGKFMLYYDQPCTPSADDLRLAGVVAAQVAFAVERTRVGATALRNESRLRFALDAAAMGTWDWDLRTQHVEWSDNLERLHGLPPGTFDGSFATYAKEIHPDDRARVIAAGRLAIEQNIPYDVEYRIVSPDGTVRWVEGKGRVEHDTAGPARMTGVCMIVTRRKEAEVARLAALEDAGRLKDEFLATLSHELRTPLNAILGWVQMLQGTPPPERVGQAVEVIGRNATLQAKLIEDILDVSRIITGKLETERLPVHLPTLISAAVSAVQPAAVAKRIQLSTHLDASVPHVAGDARRLQQVLGNVLSNAIKFTPEGGTVDIRCCVEDDIVINVADSGQGIEPSFLPFVFHRFRQADSRSTRRHGGLGIGLAIARYLLEQHGGGIEAASDGVGKGTTVRMRLPLSLATPPSAADAASATTLNTYLERLNGARILIVDDQRDSREVMATLLAGAGATVFEADSAARALAILGDEHVGMLVADIAMPDVDGYELIAQVRQRLPRLPAVAVSAYAHQEDRQRALNAGYQGYCAKPWQAPALLRTLAEAIV